MEPTSGIGRGKHNKGRRRFLCKDTRVLHVHSSGGAQQQQQAKAAVSSGVRVTTEPRQGGEEVALAEAFKASGKVNFTGPCLPSFYIDVFEETEGDEDDLPRMQKRCEAEADNAGDDGLAEGNSWSGEKYEKAVAKHGDRVFEKFHKVISKWPEQILRYVIALSDDVTRTGPLIFPLAGTITARVRSL